MTTSNVATSAANDHDAAPATAAGAATTSATSTPTSAPPLGWRAVAAALGAGLLVRLAMLALVPFSTTTGDASAYNNLALNVAFRGTFGFEEAPPVTPTVLRAPGYPMLLAALYRVAGPHAYWLVHAVQIALSLATCWLLARVARRCVELRPELPAALPLVTLWASALSPFDAVYAGAFLSENLATALVVAAMSAPLLAPPRWRWLLAGLSFGGACLVRDTFLLLVPFAAGAWALLQPGPRDWRALGRAGAALALGAALVIAPWTARNYARTHHVIAVSKGSLGSALWMGAWATDGSFTASDATGARQWPDQAFLDASERRAVAAASATNDGDARHRVFMALFERRLRHEPLRVVGRWFVRLPRLWIATRFDIFSFRPAALAYGTRPWLALKLGLLGLDALLVALGLAGTVIALRRRITPLLWLAVPGVYITLLFLPLHSFENRYSQPALPFVTLLACYAALVGRDLTPRVLRHTRSRAGETSPPACSAAPDRPSP